MDGALARAVLAPHLVMTLIVVIVADVASKMVVHDQLEIGEHHWWINGIAGLQRTENSGVAFGIGAGSASTALIVILGLTVLVWFVIQSGYMNSRAGGLALGMIIGGGIANLLDRLVDGVVTDFLVVGPWPRFNVADSALTIGILLIAILEFRAGKGFSGDGILP